MSLLLIPKAFGAGTNGLLRCTMITILKNSSNSKILNKTLNHGAPGGLELSLPRNVSMRGCVR